MRWPTMNVTVSVQKHAKMELILAYIRYKPWNSFESRGKNN